MVAAQYECVQALMDLGLTLLQAKVYYTLSNLGSATTKVIAKTSSISQPDIYRIMPTLQKLGLVEKIVTAPIVYKATPIKDGFSILFKLREQKNDELQNKAKEILSNFQGNNLKLELQQDDSQFSIISGKLLLSKKLDGRIERCNESVDITGSTENIKGALFYAVKSLNNALKNGAKVRVLAEKPTDETGTLRVPQSLKKYLTFEVRYISAPPSVIMTICDKKEVFFFTSTPPNMDTPLLWSSNPVSIVLVTSYFEELWNKAQKTNQKYRKKFAAQVKQ